MIRDTILAAYRRRQSIQGTARELGVSGGVVRKVLISAGLITTPLIERIRELSATGMPNADIAEFLGISATTVCDNSPYSKGTYLNEIKSANAVRIRKCRQRKKKAQPEQEKT